MASGRLSLAVLCVCVTVAHLARPPLAHADGGKLKVFILAGQSNMVGHGKVEMGREPGTYVQGQSAVEVEGGLGSLRRMVNENPARFGYGGTRPLVDANGNWLVRDDVHIYASVDDTIKKGYLTTGFGRANSPWIGPEFGFGQVVGQAMAEDVLLIKMAWGGKSLAVDFRPPSAVAQRGGTVGPFYNQMVHDVNTTLANLGTIFPEFAGRSYEIAGFGWHQGWNDGGSTTYANEYEDNMADFIRDVRVAFDVPEMPFVIADTGISGYNASGTRLTVINAQLAMADTGKYPEFEGSVAVVETRGMWQPAELSPSNFGYHWNHNGMVHYQIGEGMGEAMVSLVVPEPMSLTLLGLGALMMIRRRKA